MKKQARTDRIQSTEVDPKEISNWKKYQVKFEESGSYIHDGRPISKNAFQMNGINSPSLNQSFIKLLKQQSAPDVDMEIFDGNPLNYRYFMTLFREVVESKIEDPRGRLTRLIKYTTGEAKELIKHCIELPSKTGYEKALHLLYKRYGDHHTTLAAYRKEIREWPQIKPGDATAFRKFYNFLIKCQSIIGESKWNVLDSPDTICMLLA